MKRISAVLLSGLGMVSALAASGLDGMRQAASSAIKLPAAERKKVGTSGRQRAKSSHKQNARRLARVNARRA